MIFLTTFGVGEILCSFKLVLEGKRGKEVPRSSRLEFLEKFLANSFGLLGSEGNISGPLNRGGIVDLVGIVSFWEVIDSFVLVAYASLAATRTLLQ